MSSEEIDVIHLNRLVTESSPPSRRVRRVHPRRRGYSAYLLGVFLTVLLLAVVFVAMGKLVFATLLNVLVTFFVTKVVIPLVGGLLLRFIQSLVDAALNPFDNFEM